MFNYSAPESVIFSRRNVLLLSAVFLLVVLPALTLIYWLMPDARVAAAASQLRNPVAAVRIAAVRRLGELGTAARPAIPALLGLLRDDGSDEVHNAVVEVLWKIGPDTSAGIVWLRSKLKDPDAAARLHAAFILGCDRPNQLLGYVNLQKPWVEQAVAELATAVDDKDRLVRWMAVTGIMRNAGPYATGAVHALAHALGDEDWTIRDKAIIALARIGPPAQAAVHALVAEIKRPYEAGDDEDEELVMRHNDEYSLKSSAAFALGRIGGQAIPELLALLRNPDTRDPAIMAFPFAGAEAVPALAELLEDRDAGTRCAAAEALGRYGYESGAAAAPALVHALKDKDAEVRRRVVVALSTAGAGSEVSAPALASALKDVDDDVVHTAIFSLGEMGPRAKAAVPALLELGRDEKLHEATRVSAVWAALRIDPASESDAPARLVERAKQREKMNEEMNEESRKVTERLKKMMEVNPMYR